MQNVATSIGYITAFMKSQCTQAVAQYREIFQFFKNNLSKKSSYGHKGNIYMGVSEYIQPFALLSAVPLDCKTLKF